MKNIKAFLLVFPCLLQLALHGQSSSATNQIISLPERVFKKLEEKAISIESGIERQTNKHLAQIEKLEQKLKRKLWKKDSVLGREIFGNTSFYDSLLNARVSDNSGSFYSSHLDSLMTAVLYLKTSSAFNKKYLDDLTRQYQKLQSRFQTAEIIKKQLAQRQEQLKSAFASLGMIKDLKKLRKQFMYYTAWVEEFRTMFNDPAKFEARILELVSLVPSFRDFFANNSILGDLFAIPSSGAQTDNFLAGLQTRALVNQSLISRLGPDPSVTQILQQGLQSAQGSLNAIKNQVKSHFSQDEKDFNPDDISINSERAKKFKNRIEYEFNIQSQKARYSFPATSDLGVSIGYKLNARSVVGMGAAYKMGLGKGWDDIVITHQGIGLRCFIDWKIKNGRDNRQGWFISGGYEQNHRPNVFRMQTLKIDRWQRTALIGLMKRYPITLPGNKKGMGMVRISWDMLSYDQIPRTQPIVIRLGYYLK